MYPEDAAEIDQGANQRDVVLSFASHSLLEHATAIDEPSQQTVNQQDFSPQERTQTNPGADNGQSSDTTSEGGTFSCSFDGCQNKFFTRKHEWTGVQCF